MRFPILVSIAAFCALSALARQLCVGGMCYPSEDAARADGVSSEAIARALQEEHGEEDVPPPDLPMLAEGTEKVSLPEPVSVPAPGEGKASPRLAVGYMKPPALLAFLRGDASSPETAKQGASALPEDSLERHSLFVILLLVFCGGLLANLTPCVLPLVPVNLILVGRGWRRGAAYGLGIALAYGALGLAAAFGGMVFGTIQSSPWFSLFVAVVFSILGLAMSGVFFIDFTRYRARVTGGGNGKIRGLGGVFLLGVGAAVLAGACVEPILLATLLLTAKWFAAGKVWAVGLPFILGLGMGLPWPFAAAGLSVLPKPGAWMRWVNRFFAMVFFGMAVWYGWLAWTGFTVRKGGVTPETWEKAFAEARAAGKPVFVDVWASWCKNCLAMEETTFKDPAVVQELSNYTVIRLQAEDIDAFLKLADFRDLGIKGLPAFVIFKGEP